MKVFVDVIFLIVLYIWKLYPQWKAKGRDVLLVRTTMYVYLCFVLYFTLMPVITSLPFIFDHPYQWMNLIPFIDVIKGRGDFIRQVVFNVMMLVPFGFLFPLTGKKRTLLPTVLCAFGISLCIEMTQPFLNAMRSSDITDLITNTTGGLIGYLFYAAFRPVTTKILERIKGQ